MGGRSRSWPGLLAGAVLAWSAELALARASGPPLALLDLLVAALAALGLVLLPGLLVAWLPLAPKLRARSLAALAALPAAAVASGMLAIGAPSRGEPLVAAGLALLAGVPLAAAAALADPARPGRVPPWLPVGAVAAGAVSTWLARQGTLPPIPVLAVAGLAWVGLAAAALRPAGLAAGAVAVAAFALSPPTLYSAAPPRWSAAGAVPSGPDVLLIVVDTLRGDVAREMHAYRRLADEGVGFPDVQAGASWTLPSMATLHTGLPVSGHGAGRLTGGGDAGLSSGVATLAERFSAAGWDTAAVVAGNANTGPSFGFDRGFASFDYNDDSLRRFALPRHRARPDPHPVALYLLARLAPATVARPLGVRRVDGAGDAVDRALLVLAQRRERPVFLWLHLLDPHRPYKHVASSTLAPALRERLVGISIDEMRSDPFWVTPEGRDALWTAYRHEVAFVDAELMRLLDALGPAPARGRLVVLTADHGEEFLEHGGLEHGHSNFQEVLDVPLVLAGAGRGADVRGPVGLVDVAPTLLAFAGVPADGLPGRDLLGDGSPHAYVAQNLLYGDDPNAHFAVRKEHWKLVAAPEGRTLYDLEADPGERRDASRTAPGVAAALAGVPVGPGAHGAAAPLDAGERAALRELGYAE